MNVKDLNIFSYGKDIFISDNVEIRRPQLLKLGSHIAIDSGFYCTTALEMGDYIHIAPYTAIIGGAKAKLVMAHFTNISVGGRIVCGSDEFLGKGLITAPGIPEEFRDHIKIEEVRFEMFANVGANVTILPGITLGEGSVIGACSLVTKDTEPWTIYTGTPARAIKVRPREKMIENAKRMGYYST